MDRLNYLYELFINDRITPGELKEFWELVNAAGEGDPIREQALKLFGDKIPAHIEEKDWNDSLHRILDKPEEIVLRKRPRRFWWAAAAAIIFALGTGGFFLLNKTKTTAPVIASTKDVAPPAGNRAMITTSTGEKIYLDSAQDGTLLTQGGIQLNKLTDGQIAYSGTGTEVRYDVLYNPRGSKAINLTLSDGSKVWLNAESSLRYPTSFTGGDRRVEITGEAYFEIAHDKSKPFIVSKGEMNVTVLGTHFNVNAYEDETDVKVTLLEGSVRLTPRASLVPLRESPKERGVILRPGQQAQVAGNNLSVVNNADIEQVMAWKNELFLLRKADIKTVMKQIERWYDVDVEYQGEVKETFRFRVDRNSNVSTVFKALEETGGVKFKIEGRKITVMPASP